MAANPCISLCPCTRRAFEQIDRHPADYNHHNHYPRRHPHQRRLTLHITRCTLEEDRLHREAVAAAAAEALREREPEMEQEMERGLGFAQGFEWNPENGFEPELRRQRQCERQQYVQQRRRRGHGQNRRGERRDERRGETYEFIPLPSLQIVKDGRRRRKTAKLFKGVVRVVLS